MQLFLQQLFHQAKHLIRHIAEWQIEPLACHNDTAGMAESIETLLAVVAPQARITDTTEWLILVGDMHYHIIYTAATR